MDLTTVEGRELALDAVGRWFGEALVACRGDPERATGIITEAITTFYDIREAADQLRGIYAGHFFLVDGVGLEDSDRPVPWDLVRTEAAPEHAELYYQIFNQVEATVR